MFLHRRKQNQVDGPEVSPFMKMKMTNWSLSSMSKTTSAYLFRSPVSLNVEFPCNDFVNELPIVSMCHNMPNHAACIHQLIGSVPFDCSVLDSVLSWSLCVMSTNSFKVAVRRSDSCAAVAMDFCMTLIAVCL